MASVIGKQSKRISTAPPLAEEPKVRAWKYALRVVRDLRGTSCQGETYNPFFPEPLVERLRAVVEPLKSR